jgi:hypothetical protein
VSKSQSAETWRAGKTETARSRRRGRAPSAESPCEAPRPPPTGGERGLEHGSATSARAGQHRRTSTPMIPQIVGASLAVVRPDGRGSVPAAKSPRRTTATCEDRQRVLEGREELGRLAPAVKRYAEDCPMKRRLAHVLLALACRRRAPSSRPTGTRSSRRDHGA